MMVKLYFTTVLLLLFSLVAHVLWSMFYETLPTRTTFILLGAFATLSLAGMLVAIWTH